MSEREQARTSRTGRQWVMIGGKPQPKPADPRERWRREWLFGGR